jgi:hypothetical protein
MTTVPENAPVGRDVQSPRPRSVWKYTVPIADAVASLVMPALAQIVRVGTQEPGQVTFWAEVSPDGPTVLRGFRVYGTGHTIAPGDEYVGTTFEGPFVWHLYEVTA